MEWVETTGKSVEEALDAALEQLGVDESDAEYEVVEEPKVGLFGRLRGEARVRARVRPTKPRAKEDRRRKKKAVAAAPDAAGVETRVETLEDEQDVVDEAPADVEVKTETAVGRGNGRRRRGSDRREEEPMTDTGLEVPMAQQGEVAAAFLHGLLSAFGATDATVTPREVDEDTLELVVEGSDLGLLIGPKGTTLASLQDLMRTVVQRKTSARNGRLLLDISGYRQRRKEALERFARSAAEQVLANGARVVLEPMTPADRKIVHDTVNGIDGVSTTSQGEEPRRRVVLMPDASTSG